MTMYVEIFSNMVAVDRQQCGDRFEMVLILLPVGDGGGDRPGSESNHAITLSYRR